MPTDRAKAIPGVQAVFTEKYGETARVVTIGDGVSVELCGGTHLARTGAVGLLKIVEERPAGRGVRRLTCVTAGEALAHVHEMEALLEAVTTSLKCGAPQVVERIESVVEELRRSRRDNSLLRQAALKTVTEAMANSAESLSGLRVALGSLPSVTADEVRSEANRMLADGLDVAVLAWPEGGSVRLYAAASDTAQSRGVDAGHLLRKAAGSVGRNAGGNPSRANGSLAHSDEIPQTIAAARHALAEQIMATQPQD